MADPYLEEFTYRGRCSTHEAGTEAAYHVVIAQWIDGPDGRAKQIKTDALTPSQADGLGFTLNSVLGDIAVAAVRDRDAALSAKVAAEEQRDAAQEALQARIESEAQQS